MNGLSLLHCSADTEGAPVPPISQSTSGTLPPTPSPSYLSSWRSTCISQWEGLGDSEQGGDSLLLGISGKCLREMEGKLGIDSIRNGSGTEPVHTGNRLLLVKVLVETQAEDSLLLGRLGYRRRQ